MHILAITFNNTSYLPTGIEPNAVSYNAAISACEKAGRWLDAIGLFEGMKKSGIPEAQPDMVTYSALLSALATSHQVYKGTVVSAIKCISSEIGVQFS